MMKIRKFEYADSAYIKELLKENLKHHVEIDSLNIRKYEPGVEEKLFQRFKEKLDTLDGSSLVAEIDGKVVGFGLAFVKQENLDALTSHFCKTGYISKLFVAKGYRGMKIGSKLLQGLEAYLKQKRCKYVSLDVFSDNQSAYEVYKKAGYADRYIHMKKTV